MKIINELQPSMKIELWGGSTKHPDMVLSLKNYEEKTPDLFRDARPIEDRIFQWLCHEASVMLWVSTSYELIDLANKYRIPRA